MLGPLTGWISSKPSPSTDASAPIIRYSTGSPFTRVSCSSGGLKSNPPPRAPPGRLVVGLQRSLDVPDHDRDLRDLHRGGRGHDLRAVVAGHASSRRLLTATRIAASPRRGGSTCREIIKYGCAHVKPLRTCSPRLAARRRARPG